MSAKELSYYREDFDEQLNSMSPEEIWDLLAQENPRLASLGVKHPISTILYVSGYYGGSYEFRKKMVLPVPLLSTVLWLYYMHNLI